MDRKELIEALERATGPDRKLDVAIFKTLNHEYASDEWQEYHGGLRHVIDSSDVRTPPQVIYSKVTSSIDDALKSLPDGWSPLLLDWQGELPTATIIGPGDDHGHFPEYTASAKLMQCAICAAALRAREEQ